MCVCAVSAAHKSVLLLPSKVQEVKKKAETDSAYVAGVRTIISVADRLTSKPDITKVDYLGMAYLLSDDKRYAEKAKEILLKNAYAKTWSDKEMMMRNPPWQSELQMAHKMFAVSNAYDAIYNTLTPSERKEIAEGYYRLAIKPLAEDWILPDTRIHTLNSMGHNWWASCVGMCGVAALAFSDELPECKRIVDMTNQAIYDWFSFEGDDFQNKSRSFDRNGGMYECINYAAYGYQEALLYILALKNSTGKTLKNIEQLDNMPDFFIHTSYPTDSVMMSTYFGDSHRTTTGHNAMMLLDAIGKGSRDIDWYLARITDGQHREFLGLSTPVGILYAPDLEPVKAPSMVLSAIYPDMGWATMRDSWDNNSTMLAVKSGITWNHAHADAGSFILFHKGRDIIGEAGRCWYKLPEYRNYFFQSEAHNVVTFDGKGQPRFQQYHSSPLPGKVSNLIDTLGVKYLLADATGPNSDRFNRYKRSFLWLDNVILIIDDLSSHEQGEYQWLWHPVGNAEKKGIDLDVKNGEAHVLLRQLYPETLAPSDFLHDYPANMTWTIHDAPGENNSGNQPYYSFHLPKKHDRVKGVTAIILDPDNVPSIECRKGDGWIGLRIKSKDKTTDVYLNLLADGSLMHCNSWVSPDGWNTDAYITALTYNSNDTDLKNPVRKAIIYGSRVKNPQGKTLYTSATKHNHIW